MVFLVLVGMGMFFLGFFIFCYFFMINVRLLILCFIESFLLWYEVFLVYDYLFRLDYVIFI